VAEPFKAASTFQADSSKSSKVNSSAPSPKILFTFRLTKFFLSI